MSAKTGREMCLYINTGTVASPTWLEVDEIGDLQLTGLVRAIAELKRRASQFTKGLAGLIGLVRVEFQLLHGLGATVFEELRQNFLDGTPIECAVMNGPITTDGSEGWRMPVIVADFPWNQPLEGAADHACAFALAYMEEGGTEIDPSWHTVSGT